MSHFAYTALKNAHDIRLLILQPGPAEAPITCRLEHKSLDVAPLYEAISYVWGDPSDTRRLQCGEGVLDVTVNLHTALRRFRLEDSERVLWADAICIDQNNLEERGSQVKLMGQLYARSRETLIWLGESDEFTQRAFNAFVDLRKRLPSNVWDEEFSGDHFREILLYGNPDGGIRDHETGINDMQAITDWTAVANLLARSWFRRKWIVQEVLRSPAATVYCGDHSISWVTLADTMFGISTSDLLQLLPAALRLATPSGQSLDNICVMGHIQNGFGAHDFASFQEQLRNFACTDPLDHVFAILGIYSGCQPTESISSALLPDYTLSYAELLIRYARWSMEDTKCLDFLSFPLPSVEDQSSNTRSWFPISRTNKCNRRPPGFLKTFEATKNSKVCGEVSEDGKTIQFLGMVVDTIVSRTIPLPNDMTERFEFANIDEFRVFIFNHPIKFWLMECLDLAMSACCVTQEGALILVASCITWNIDLAGDRLWDGFESFLAQYLDLLQGIWNLPLANMQDYSRLMETISATEPHILVAFDRRLASTMERKLCSIPSHAEVGDQICLLYGGKVPYVIRSCGDGNYRFIGDCYVHGLMYGEELELGEDDQVLTFV